MKKVSLFLNYFLLFVVFGACSVYSKIEFDAYSITKIPAHFPTINQYGGYTNPKK
jgi:hypothetical protein